MSACVSVHLPVHLKDPELLPAFCLEPQFLVLYQDSWQLYYTKVPVQDIPRKIQEYQAIRSPDISGIFL